MPRKFFEKLKQFAFLSVFVLVFALFLFSGWPLAAKAQYYGNMYYPSSNMYYPANYNNSYYPMANVMNYQNNNPYYGYNRPNYFINYYTGMPMPNYPNPNYDNYSTFLNYISHQPIYYQNNYYPPY